MLPGSPQKRMRGIACFVEPAVQLEFEKETHRVNRNPILDVMLALALGRHASAPQ